MFKLTLPFVLASVSLALPLNSVGKLPSLGWNSWNAFHCTLPSAHSTVSPPLMHVTGDVDETKVMSAANSFISLGLKDAGYMYVNIDVGASRFFCSSVD
jgi:alpha-galactosidase